MNVDVVVDVGNSRIKWGRCAPDRVLHFATLSYDVAEWEAKLAEWDLPAGSVWAVASVVPKKSDALVAWLRHHGHQVCVVESHRQLPIEVSLEYPDRVGIDRLLNAAAVVKDLARRRLPAVIVDAGSAVTVDWVDEFGNFRGGAILPGIRLMAQSLHVYTALLPLVQIKKSTPYVPGLDTPGAIEAGIFAAVTGGINALIEKLARKSVKPTAIYLTGGDALLLKPALDDRADYWPLMTLEGLRLTAEAQPELTH
jgi:type III pantothenate kinase